MNGLLASVCTATEAKMVLGAHVDIVDCKNPHQGALGALPAETVTRIVRTVASRRLTSATTGDDLRGARRLLDAIRETADCGVDYVKFGLFDPTAAPALLDTIDRAAVDHDLVAVCFADRGDPTHLIGPLSEHGVRGIMLDTADKAAGPLTALWSASQLAGFVAAVQARGLICGLAGRLALADIPDLLTLQADYLGFRSALCGGDRRAGIDAAALMGVRQAIPFRPNAPAIRLEGVALH